MGTLSDNQIIRLIESGSIRDSGGSGPDLLLSRVQPASIDLAIGDTAYRIRSSFLPQGESVASLLPALTLYPVDLNVHPYLEKGAVYLIPLAEKLSLPAGIEGKANPKSSTGRVDVFTRVLTEKAHRFDEVPPGYEGLLYLEVFSRSFPLKVKPGLSLSQLRLFENRHILTDRELGDRHKQYPLFWYSDGVPGEMAEFREGITLGVDLSFDSVVGYKARSNTTVLDMTGSLSNPAEPFWEPISRPEAGSLILDPESFYLFASRAKIRIPSDMAGEMVEFDAQSGELRTHYAGFFDPGFGLVDEGARAVLEIRPHDVPFRVVDGQMIFRLRFEWMDCPPHHPYGVEIGSNYSRQALKLSKYFGSTPPFVAPVISPSPI
uniref:2'-deoxycytidine 5'-triphosphate deaminase n=1 Tax=Leptospirillum ferriphilum TaxID=178606 RepID=A0A7C3LS02_9BACT